MVVGNVSDRGPPTTWIYDCFKLCIHSSQQHCRLEAVAMVVGKVSHIYPPQARYVCFQSVGPCTNHPSERSGKQTILGTGGLPLSLQGWRKNNVSNSCYSVVRMLVTESLRKNLHGHVSSQALGRRQCGMITYKHIWPLTSDDLNLNTILNINQLSHFGNKQYWKIEMTDETNSYSTLWD